MGIELAFRAAFYVVSVVMYMYTRTAVVSTVLLAGLAWIGFNHPEDNSTGAEILAFVITGLSAIATAALLGYLESVSWIIDLEWKIVTPRLRRKLRVHDAVAWLFALIITALVYVSTEIANYDKGTFFRVQSVAILALVALGVYVIDQIASSDDYRILPPGATYLHGLITLVELGAISIDILARDPPFWVYLVPAYLAVAALSVPRVVLLLRSEPHKKLE